MFKILGFKVPRRLLIVSGNQLRSLEPSRNFMAHRKIPLSVFDVAAAAPRIRVLLDRMIIVMRQC